MVKKIASPELPELLEGNFYLEDETTFSGILSEGEDQSYLSSRNIVLKNSHIKKLAMQKSRLERFECSNVVFEKCDFSNLEWFGASFHRVHFKQCKLTGTNFSDSFLRDCVFEECVANLSSFSYTNMKFVRFSDNQLKNTDFFDSYWKDLVVENNNLSGSNWVNTPLKDLDFTTNTFSQINLSMELLRGLIVNQEQAIIIAAGLGLVIE
ncbi:pentapeptide repeat family protein [Enterococcus mundtii 1A]|uniref:pentapeptide repeat-containing protein n=1 Tax=Enterococcus mundtii TaxID=53346 RepID=UPI00230437F3|nr:pentapeptide repeat-containing protein [Enterococcus mundtii]MDA9429760.1 pentapeptide repeat family protein [Enterococcus mundtii 1A]